MGIKIYNKQSLLEKVYRGILSITKRLKAQFINSKLGKMSGKCSFIIFASMMILFVKSENNGNTLVNCAACQSVQVQDWSCDVNCQVIKGSNGEYRCQLSTVLNTDGEYIAVNYPIVK